MTVESEPTSSAPPRSGLEPGFELMEFEMLRSSALSR